MRMRTLLPLIALLFGAGCRNSCQQLCQDIADYGESTCGLEFTSDQISQCISDHNKEDAETRSACSDAAPSLEEEWTCEDIQEYFD